MYATEWHSAKTGTPPARSVLFLPHGKTEARQSGGASPGAQHPRAPSAVLRGQPYWMGAGGHHSRDSHHPGGQRADRTRRCRRAHYHPARARGACGATRRGRRVTIHGPPFPATLASLPQLLGKAYMRTCLVLRCAPSTKLSLVERTHAIRQLCDRLSDGCKSAPPRHHHRRIRCRRIGRSRPAKPAALRLGLVAAWRRTHIVLISWCAGRKCSLNPHINNVCWQNITTERRQLLHNEYTNRKSRSVVGDVGCMTKSCRARICLAVPKKPRR